MVYFFFKVLYGFVYLNKLYNYVRRFIKKDRFILYKMTLESALNFIVICFVILILLKLYEILLGKKK